MGLRPEHDSVSRQIQKQLERISTNTGRIATALEKLASCVVEGKDGNTFDVEGAFDTYEQNC